MCVCVSVGTSVHYGMCGSQRITAGTNSVLPPGDSKIEIQVCKASAFTHRTIPPALS